ncbi:hypothetical protein AAFC00_002896 [Neodothiora populina]|uniref:Uncharacterized protein n=1 Tax=Neodothiora populina TaxID=2781224 RepID=A0ABR3P8L0_9PEZI
MSSNILSDRDVNQIMQNEQPSNPFMSKPSGEGDKPKSMDYHRQMMEKKLQESQGQSGPAYVSPSDAIMSPASQKLSSFKQRQMDKNMGGAPVKSSRSLFQSISSAREKELGSTDEQQEKSE